MDIASIKKLWEDDSKINRMELGDESLKIPLLHSKYYNIYIDEKLSLRKAQQDYKDLLKNKQLYYSGAMDKAELRDLGWEPQPLKILRQDMPIYMDADKDIGTQSLIIAYQQEKVDFLESIIKSLTARGFNIKNAIEWARFQVGG